MSVKRFNQLKYKVQPVKKSIIGEEHQGVKRSNVNQEVPRYKSFKSRDLTNKKKKIQRMKRWNELRDQYGLGVQIVKRLHE